MTVHYKDDDKRGQELDVNINPGVFDDSMQMYLAGRHNRVWT